MVAFYFLALRNTLCHWVDFQTLLLALISLISLTVVTMSLSLKHIPCPAGNICTAFHCVFGHDKDRGNDEDNKQKLVSSGDATKAPRGSLEDEELPRKRQKVNNSSVYAPCSKGTEGPYRQSKDPVVPQEPAAIRPRTTTATRTVSPPPFKRPRSHAPSSKPLKPSSPKARQTPPTRKSESLNPRLLKSSPASHEIRFKLVKLLFQELTRLNTDLKKDGTDEDLKLVLSDQELIHRALDDEETVAVQKAAVYSNVMKNKVMQYKRMSTAQWKTERSKEASATEGKLLETIISDESKMIETGLTSALEVQLLGRLLTPIDDLSNHGYATVVPSDESVDKAKQGLEAAKGWEKCERCQQRFQVFPGRREEDGALTSGGTCIFHWGKTYFPERAPGDNTRVPKRYRCCGEEVGESVGCFTRDHHVYKAGDTKRLAAILNFTETPENPAAPANRGVCFDCEMCYTVYGLELVRLTATSWPTGEELLDVLVHPLGEILDLNSRFSGVWPEDMAQAVPWSADDPTPSKSGMESASEEGEISSKKKLKIVSSPQVARDLLFSLISPTTPLIGHGLENDLNAVRIVHHTLIDTVLLYPHRAGLPFRNGLKMLMDTHLNRKIQQETLLGHDSAEDARAAGDLVRLKLAQHWKDMQRAGWKIVDGEFLGPEKKGGGEGGLTEVFLES